MFIGNYSYFKKYYRILFSSILISIKYNEDDFYSNTHYAKIAGISLSELNDLEQLFLKINEFKLFVNDDCFKKYKSFLDGYKY